MKVELIRPGPNLVLEFANNIVQLPDLASLHITFGELADLALCFKITWVSDVN